MRYDLVIKDPEMGKYANVIVRLPWFMRRETYPDNPESNWYCLENDIFNWKAGRCQATWTHTLGSTDILLCVKGTDKKWHAGVQLYRMFDGLTLIEDSGYGVIRNWWHKQKGEAEIVWWQREVIEKQNKQSSQANAGNEREIE